MTNEKPYDSARVISIIETDLTRRGDGKDDPIRRVVQYWTLEGELLAERDPCERPKHE